MDDHLFLLNGIDGWEQVLLCYAQEDNDESSEQQSAEPDAVSDEEQNEETAIEVAESKPKRASQPWKRRVDDTLGMDETQVSRIHGRLVAAGLLEIDVLDRTAGLCYRLTRDGKRVVKQVDLAQQTDGQMVEQEEPADYKLSA